MAPLRPPDGGIRNGTASGNSTAAETDRTGPPPLDIGPDETRPQPGSLAVEQRGAFGSARPSDAAAEAR